MRLESQSTKRFWYHDSNIMYGIFAIIYLTRQMIAYNYHKVKSIYNQCANFKLHSHRKIFQDTCIANENMFTLHTIRIIRYSQN